MIRSPPASSLADGIWPSPNSAMRPSAKAIQPRSITRSGRTILALPSTVSDPVEVISSLPSCRGCKRCYVDDPVGDQMTDLIIVDARDHGNARALLFIDQFDHHGTIGRIERSGRLVQQQDRQIGNKTTRNVDALLLAP